MSKKKPPGSGKRKLLKQNTGEAYENFIKYYYEELSTLSRSEVHIYKKLIVVGKTGEFEADVVYDFDYLGHRHRVIVECKDYSKNVDYPTMRSFVAAIIDTPACYGVIYSQKGFGTNPKLYAEKNGIECITLSEFDGLRALIAKRLEATVILNKKFIGEPFWSVSDSDSELFIEVHADQHVLPIFYVKRDAELYAEIKSASESRTFWTYGIRQEQLRFLILKAKDRRLKFSIMTPINPDEKDLKSVRFASSMNDPDDIANLFLTLYKL